MRCILHIGTEKTGTTLLQKWLYENRENLSAQGVALTTASEHPNNRKLAAYCMDHFDDFFRLNKVFDAAGRERFFDGFEEKFFGEINDLEKEHDAVIFTSEHFHSRLLNYQSVKSLRNLLGKRFSDIRVVCYFREQSRVRTSLYSTALMNLDGRRLSDFQKGIATDDPYYNYYDFFRKWEDLFGFDRLCPRLFDRKHLLEGDIRIDFIKSVLPEVSVDELTFEITSANEALTDLQALFFRSVNLSQRQYFEGAVNPALGHLKSSILNTKTSKMGARIQDPRQNRMYEDFNDSNVEFFSRYFGERRNLFDRPDPIDADGETSLIKTEDFEQILEQLLRTSGLVVLTQKEVSCLRDVVFRQYEKGALNTEEALTILMIALRAQPEGQIVRDKVRQLQAAMLKND